MATHETISLDKPDTAIPAASNMRGRNNDKSEVLDAALKEFSLRQKVDGHVDIDDFCDAYPAYRSSVRRLLSVYQCFAEHPEIVEGLERVDWPKPGQQFMGFSIHEELGQGAFARVYSAHEPAMGNREVVLKVAMGGAAEAETLGRLSHPNVATVYSVQVDAESGLSVICMPLVAQRTLCDLLDEAFANQRAPINFPALTADGSPSGLIQRLIPPSRRLWSETVVQIGVKLAAALAYTHSKGILHLDLKPSNVLISPDGEPILIDFNLSKDLQCEFVQAGGTLPYMSPEQLHALGKNSGDSEEILDARSDIFSLGVVLYEALTGRLPFGYVSVGSDDMGHVEKSIECRKTAPKPVRLCNRLVDSRVSDAIDRCLAFDLADRFQSAEELAGCLRRSLSSMARMKRSVRMHPVASTLIAAALTLGTIGGAAWWVQRPTFAEREYTAAITLCQQGKHEEALRRLDRLFSAEGPSLERLLARGWVRLKVENWESAAVDFEAVSEISSGGSSIAMAAYCRAKIGRHINAISLYQQAIDEGYSTAGIYNNLGVSYMKRNSSVDADRCFTEAIRLDDRLQEPYVNRASLGIKECHRGNMRRLKQGISDIQEAITIGPPSPELFYKAAVLLVLAKDMECTSDILAYLRHAVEGGLSTEVLRVDPLFEQLVDKPGFPQERKASETGKFGSMASRIVSPRFVPGSGLPEF